MSIKLSFRLMHDSPEKTESSSSGVELDPEQLSPGALRGLVEEYVSREGTDYGHADWSLEEKVTQVFQQLDRGEALIVFDLELESASIVAVSDHSTTPTGT